MKITMRTAAAAGFLLAVALPSLHAAEYFVSLHGSDMNDGLTRVAAFATIQKGVDALQAGDTLTILPGEFFESVRRAGLGDTNAETTIRADIPGTVLLRGDVPAPEFQKVDGYRFVYAAVFDPLPQAVLEQDTLTILEKRTNPPDVEYEPGTFCHDPQKRIVYISSSDMQPPALHRYTVAVTPTSGLNLEKPVCVTVEGLAATGFYRSAQKGLNWARDYEWGVLLNRPEACTLRNCAVFLNAGGIALVNGPSNRVEDCQAYANYCQNHAPGGNIMIYGGSNCTDNAVRNCRAFKSNNWGIKYYGHFAGPCLLAHNLVWGIGGSRVGGNAADYQIKGSGSREFGSAIRCVGLGHNFSVANVTNCVMGGQNPYRWGMTTSPDNIFLKNEPALDFDREFADPRNLDFRLQADSRFCGTGPQGEDRGAFVFQTNVFYLHPDGLDEHDGLSLRKPWRTLARALPALRPGDTLYLDEGIYAAGPAWTGGHPGGAAISIRSRGRTPAVIAGRLDVMQGSSLSFERLHFADGVQLHNSREVAFESCSFAGAPIGLQLEDVQTARITHAAFVDCALELKNSTGLFLSGNLYAGLNRPAVRMDTAEGVAYSDYNSYAGDSCWSVGDAIWSLEALRRLHDRCSQMMAPDWDLSGQVPRLRNSVLFAGRGPRGTAIGFYRPAAGSAGRMAGPFVHSVSESTANIEWWLSQPATCELVWGETLEMTHALTNVACGLYTSFSITSLQPDRKLFFGIRSIVPKPQDGMDVTDEPLPSSEPVPFQTLPAGTKTATYYVVPDGDDTRSGLSRDQAWRTVNHAAGRARAGDTVLIAGGTYRESVKIRSSGDSGAPLTFRCAPGEKVVFDGDSRSLVHAFVVNRKQHCRFDGFYFVNYSGTIFSLAQSDHIQISRCFHDGRGAGYAGGILSARDCASVLLENCVVINGFGGLSTVECPDLRLEHNVFLRNLISAVNPVNQPHQRIYFKRNIFTDGLPSKVTAPVMEVASVESLAEENNCYYLRVPDTEKKMFMFYGGESYWRCARAYGWPTNPAVPPVFADLTRLNLQEYQAQFGDTGSFVADPLFQGASDMSATDKDGRPLFMADHLVGKKDLDFPDLFATHPEVVKKGIGLVPEDFKDFHFNIVF